MSKKSLSHSKRTLAFEPLEQRQLLDADATVLPTVDDLRAGVAEEITTYLAGLETALRQATIEEMETRLPDLELNAQSAQEALALLHDRSLYARSSFAKSPDDFLPEIREQAAPYLEQYASHIDGLLQLGMQRADALANGTTALVRPLDRQIISTLTPRNMYADVDNKVRRLLPHTFRMYGLEFPRKTDDIFTEVNALRAQEENVRAEAHMRQEEWMSQQKIHTTLQESVRTQNFSIGPQAASIDGNTPEERAALDSLIEQSLSERLPLPLSLTTSPLPTGPRVDVRNGILLAALTEEEFTAIAQSVSVAVTAASDTSTVTEPFVRDALAKDAVFTDLLMQSTEAAEEYLEAQKPLATVEEMRDAMATRYTDVLKEYETADLLRDIAEAERLYPTLVAEQTAAQEALRLFEAQSWYQRSDYCDSSCKNTPTANLSPGHKAHQEMIHNAFTWAFMHLDAKAAGKTQEANNYYSYVNSVLYRYLQRGTYEYNMAKQYGFYIPRVDTIIWQAKVVRDRQANTRAAAIAKDAAVAKNLADRAEWAERLETGNLNLRRQAPALDGNTAAEADIIDSIIEQAMEKGLRTDTDLQALRIRTGARVDLEEGALRARMTDAEFADLGLQLANAVSASDGTIGQVTDAVRAALLENAAVKDILDRSQTLMTRHRESPLMAEVLEDVEAANEIPYARIRVEVLSTNDGDGSTVFSIRLRNPGTQSYITGANIHQLIEHPEGLADGRVNMIMAQPWNFMYKGVQDSEIVLYADAQRTKMLDRVLIRYDIRHNVGAVLTEQSDWDDYEEGKLERIPIEPKLMIYGTYKHNVLVAMRSPSDQSKITFNQGGIWETDPLEHEGGTNNLMETIMFNFTLPSGQYPLYLYERPNGLLQDTVLFQWDKATQTLTPVDASDGAPEIPEGDESAQKTLAYFQTAATMDDHIFYGEQPWQRILHSEVIERTKDFPAPYNVTYDFYEAFYNTHPELRSENIEATVDAEWAIRGTTWTRKQIRDSVYNRRKDLLLSMNDRCIEYTIALGEILGKAVEGMQKIRKGHDPATAFQDVHTLWEKYENPRNLNGYGYRATCVDVIQQLTGLRLPTPEVAIEIARRVMDQLMVRLQEMITDHNRTTQQLVNSGYHLNGDGYWVRNSSYTPSTFNPDLDDASRTATRFSRWFGEEVAMADPRLDVVAQSDGSMRVVIAALDQYSTEEPSLVEINRIFDVALATTTDYEVGGFNLLDGIVTDEAMSFIDLRIALRKYDDATLMREAEGWYRRTGTPGQYPTYGGQSVRDDTAAGRIFNGIMQQAAVKQGAELRLVLCIAERIIGIRTIPLYNLLKAGDTAGFFTGLAEDFRTRNYENIFVSQPGVLPETSHIAGFTLDRAAYTEQNEFLHLSFDVVGANPTFSQWNVYLADLQGNALPGVPPLLPENAMGTLSATIPLSRIPGVLSHSFQQRTFTLRLAVWGKPTDTAGLPGDRISDPFTVTFHPRSGVNGGENTGNIMQHLSDDPVENAVLNQLSFPVAPGGWSYGMGSGYHKGSLLYSLDLNSANDRDKPVTVAATGTVVDVDLASGWVQMRHETLDGQVWYSNYHHMTHILEDLTGMAYTGPEEAKHRGMDTTVAATGLAAAQAAIDALIAQDLTLTQNASLGLVGNEGDSSGAHLHLDSYLADGTPVNLFGWAEAMQPNFTITETVGGKFLDMQWNQKEQSLVYYTDRILIERVNIKDANNKVIGADNFAYAWHEDPAQREQITYSRIENVRQPDGSIGYSYLWVRKSESERPMQYWSREKLDFVNIPYSN